MIKEIEIHKQTYLVETGMLQIKGEAVKEIQIEQEIHYVTPRFDLEVSSELTQKEIYLAVKAHLEQTGLSTPNEI
jgi:hypothetical protein